LVAAKWVEMSEKIPDLSKKSERPRYATKLFSPQGEAGRKFGGKLKAINEQKKITKSKSKLKQGGGISVWWEVTRNGTKRGSRNINTKKKKDKDSASREQWGKR